MPQYGARLCLYQVFGALGIRQPYSLALEAWCTLANIGLTFFIFQILIERFKRSKAASMTVCYAVFLLALNAEGWSKGKPPCSPHWAAAHLSGAAASMNGVELMHPFPACPHLLARGTGSLTMRCFPWRIQDIFRVMQECAESASGSGAVQRPGETIRALCIVWDTWHGPVDSNQNQS